MFVIACSPRLNPNSPALVVSFLVKEAQRLDPEFCRVHYQFAHIYVKQAMYLEMEDVLVEAILCRTTASQAIDLWTNYWPSMMQADPIAQKRKEKLMKSIIARQQLQANDKQSDNRSKRDEL